MVEKSLVLRYAHVRHIDLADGKKIHTPPYENWTRSVEKRFTDPIMIARYNLHCVIKVDVTHRGYIMSGIGRARLQQPAADDKRSEKNREDDVQGDFDENYRSLQARTLLGSTRRWKINVG